MHLISPDTKIDFLGQRKIALGFSIMLILVSLGALMVVMLASTMVVSALA